MSVDVLLVRRLVLSRLGRLLLLGLVYFQLVGVHACTISITILLNKVSLFRLRLLARVLLTRFLFIQERGAQVLNSLG